MAVLRVGEDILAYDDLVVDFVLRLKRLDRSPATIKYYEATVRRFLKHYRKVHLDLLTSEHLERYLYERPLSPRSMSTECGVLRTFFRFLIRSKGYKFANPADGVDRPRWREKTKPSPTLDDYRAILSACRDEEERLLVSLAYTCGFRVSELRSIRWQDVDLQRHRITVIGKGSRERTVPFPGSVLGLMGHCREDREHLFPSRQWVGLPRQARWVQDTFKAIGRRAGLRYKLTVHVLRYGFARLGRKAGLSLEEVSFLMGHADIRTTANVYHRLHIEDVQPGYIEKVEKFLAQPY